MLREGLSGLLGRWRVMSKRHRGEGREIGCELYSFRRNLLVRCDDIRPASEPFHLFLGRTDGSLNRWEAYGAIVILRYATPVHSAISQSTSHTYTSMAKRVLDEAS